MFGEAWLDKIILNTIDFVFSLKMIILILVILCLLMTF